MVTDTGTPGRLRRLTKAAIHADSAIMQADGLATTATQILDDIADIVDRLDVTPDRLDQLIVDCRREVAGIGNTRREVHAVVESVQRMVDLVEWMLTPAFVAREQLDRAVGVLTEFRHSLRMKLIGSPLPPAPQVELAEVHLLAG
ncbi:hypothetical protein [Antrihabitans spumae]|uniref:PhoU domain-containing protein n=1 Tax=Antrihabitans spumae TaxID=3373370 RepID=A0ABW7K0H3_9NOCA